ncbi:NADPH:quinone reductase [Enterococcus sp. JM4C]|uniref:YhdH/YhfP family quinone oxidoreductase n=1 Tax=Candidatus Enterococcus huntleyi TaxID=1857217 RepID=UPI00137B6A13|nr:YhdH/YhfP family quinone oxidoreductase [Enterococcus sp. JM4C]KAF1295599.1 NADPH:quinone reductase [Enterococcus sp. JM4C]
MKPFQALLVKEVEEQIVAEIEQTTIEQLSQGNVLIEVAYSSVNYKDMLAVQKNAGVIREYPMIPGIDFSGTVVESDDEAISVGQKVLVTGFAVGMSHTGGFSEYARVPSEWVIPLPETLTLKEAMIFGTAGLTAALSIQALENNGLSVDNQPEILVTGATGGVGSLAVQILAKLGFTSITAMVRKENQVAVAQSLGAQNVVFASEFADQKRPLNKQKFHYILDTVGGQVASDLIPFIHYGGSMSLCGNAGGIKLATTVLPFILRGVNLLGIDSVNISVEERTAVWEKLATSWNVSQTTLFDEVTLAELPKTIEDLKAGQHLGRTIVKL